jgi:hypothetical protein
MRNMERPDGRPRHRRNRMKMLLRGIGWDGMDLIHLVQDRGLVEGSC